MSNKLYETGAETEIVPGVHERRTFLRRSLTSVAALIALRGIPLAQTAAGSAHASLAWDEFLKQAVPVARQLIADPAFDIDEYLYRIGSLATRLQDLPDTRLGPYKEVDPHVWFGPSFRGSPFFIIQWRMEPGALLPAHNHPNASVCTAGFEGEVRVRNFQVFGDVPERTSTKSFRVIETRSEMLSHGRISTLSPTRDNIHCFQAAKVGARGIDINTLHGDNSSFCFLDMNDKPVDADLRIFEARWNAQLGQPRKG